MTEGCRRVLVTAALASSAPVHAQDRALAVPGMQVLLENDRVRVQYHDVAVGETVAMHSHPAYVAYVMAPYKARLRTKDGTERVVDRQPGDVFWGDPTTHTVENLGMAPIHNLIVELKDAPDTPASPCPWPPALDAAAGGDHRVAFENDRIRVLDVSVAPGERQAVHAHCWPGVSFAMWQGVSRDYDGEGRLIGEVKEAPPASRFPQARWMEPQGPHARHNLDARPSHVLRFELKR